MSQSSVVSVVVIGYGNQGKQLTVAAINAGMDVAAACDPRRSAFEPPYKTPKEVADWQRSFLDASKWYPPPPSYSDSKKLYQDHSNPDIAIIATPTSTHLLEVRRAVEGGAGKIFLEEPISTSVRDALLIIRETITVPLSVHHTRGYWESHEEVGRLIREGKIGTLVSITITCGGCRLGMLGIHWIRCAMDWTNSEVDYVWGKIGLQTEVDPRGDQFHDHPGQVFIVFKNGVTAHIVQDEGMATSPIYFIQGTTGCIEGRQYHADPPYEKWWVRSLVNPAVSPVKDYMGKEETYEWPYPITWKDQGIRALKELAEGKIRYDGFKSMVATSVLVAAYASHQQGGIPVRFPLPEVLHDFSLQHP